MRLNFFLREMTHMRYFVPIVKEGNSRGIKSTFYVTSSNKYNCPKKSEISLLAAAKEFGIEIRPGSEIVNANGVIITSEESGLDLIKQNSVATKVALCYQTDFILSYSKYINVMDHVVLPSENVANYYGLLSDKNIYTGIPKYDTVLDKKQILKRYAVREDKKRVLFIWPKSRDLHKMPIDIINNFNELGYQVLVKTRGKDPVTESTLKTLQSAGNRVFSDTSWYPHTTQELLEICDLVVNSGSTTIEECVMHNVPLINFDIKPSVRHGRNLKHRVTYDFLYDYDFCLNLKGLDKSFNTEKLREMVSSIVDTDHDESFAACKKEWLYDHKNSCKNLLDMLTS
jgi:UDP-N-acetylglucosamine:LPS N-acetylglucosamine transferase